MTELLIREKEFIKLNEQLDKMATSVHGSQQHKQQQLQQQHPKIQTYAQHQSRQQQQEHPDHQDEMLASGKDQQQQQQKQQLQQMLNTQSNSYNTNSKLGSNNMVSRVENRFQTYLKSKGIHTSAANTQSTTTPTKEQHWHNNSMMTPRDTNNYRYSNRSNNSNSNSNANALSSGTATNTTNSVSLATAAMRKQSNRIYNANSKQLNGTNFTIKYRNPKFVESPSLEVLVRDEYSAMRCEKIASGHASLVSTFADSGTSFQFSNGNNSTISKRSHLSSISTGSKKHVSTDGLIKFLKSKITILEEDHERITKEINQQRELLDKALERSKMFEQQRDQACAKNNSANEQISKLESELDETSSKLKESIAEQMTQQKDLENTRKELKTVTQTNHNLEKRLHRAKEDLENARNALTLMKNAERDIKEAARNDAEAKEKQIKSLKKQRADLLNAYKKQMFLIDNLKRQNLCMEQAKMISFGEKEFSKVLEWKINS